ncbi:MAG: glycosyltransferase [Hyphomicrobiaceae bacterium]|nr:glycosyltransferase [Hyphomicrobiaceae bacterium]
MNYRLCVIHSFDPRGAKVGGLETFIRDMIAFLPEDFSFLMIGVDAIGDLELGKVTRQEFRGKSFDFLPVLHFPDDQAREAARSIRQSINFQFMQGLLRHIATVRAVLKQQPTSIDLQRVEFATLVRALGVPFIQMLHGEGAPKLQMDSLLSSYRYVHNVNEWLAVKACNKFLCVNPIITERIRQTYPAQAAKIDTLSTWVDPQTFAPRPLPADDGFRVAFAGRLDLFKVPSLMFRTIAKLAEKLGDGVEFHYMGTSDPHRFAEFAEIEKRSVLHGFKTASGVADVLANAHAGILTSEFEGMPFSVLEALGAGRPVGAIHLPQLASVIKDGVSGYLVPRSDDRDDMAERLADAFVEIRNRQRDGRITPAGVAAEIADFRPEVQLAKCYENHRDLQRARWGQPRSRPLSAAASL